MPRIPFPNFCNGSYQLWSPNADCERTVNLYPEIVESGAGKNKIVLNGTPGLSLFTTLPTTPVRGLWAGGAPITDGGRLFAVGGSKLYEVFNGGGVSLLGDVGNDGTPVQMFPNGTQLFVVSAGMGYLANGVSVTPVIPARTGAFLDGYFIAAKPQSKQYNISALNDGSTWDPLDFAIKEGYPDNIASILVDHEELWLFGEQTTEVWRNEGDATFPFVRDPGAFIHQGIVAPWSAVRLQNGVAWLGGNTEGKPVAWLAEGFQPRRISNHGVEQFWAQMSDVKDAYAYVYEDNGHFFWVINFPSGNMTWVYDAATKMWHERAWWNGFTIQRHRGNTHAFVFGKHLVGDHSTGAIYTMSDYTYDDTGTPIHRIRTTSHFADEHRWYSHRRLELEMERGTGTVADPVITMEYSDDLANTWSTPKTATSGSTGQYKKRVLWRNLGRSRSRIYRVSTAAVNKIAFTDAYLDVTPGTN